MAEAAEAHYADRIGAGRFAGLAATREGYEPAARRIRADRSRASRPRQEKYAAADAALAIGGRSRTDDLVLALISGGASALWAAPVEGITLAEKQDLTRALLRAGAPISDINCVRKHLSRIKGGRLASAAFPAKLVTLAISDVPGDAPDAIGSGPTVPDPTTLAEARSVLAQYEIRPAQSIRAALDDPANETPKPGEAFFADAQFVLAATPGDALDAAARETAARGYRPVMLGDALEGEARDVARRMPRSPWSSEKQERVALISGGELTVTMTGDGKGGPNQEYALALALALDGAAGIIALAADTDGIDGGGGTPDDPAGAYVLPDSCSEREKSTRTRPNIWQKTIPRDSFEMLDDLIVSGPTFTNVNDLRVILVEPGPGA